MRKKMSEAVDLVQDPGIYPYLDRVLVKPDPIEDKTEGGIIIAPQIAEQHQQAQATGTLISIGPDAFIHSRTEVFDSEGRIKEVRVERYKHETCPKPGDRVQFAKYGGLVNIGADGEEYRILNDRDITCRVEAGVQYTGIQSRRPVGVKS
jgi:chaperonin GroES